MASRLFGPRPRRSVPSPGPEPEEAHVGLGALATDALEPWELADLDAHLAECRWCRQEAVGFTETTAELARLTASPAPAAVRVAVLEAITTVRQLPPTPRAIGGLGERREVEAAEAIAVGADPRDQSRRRAGRRPGRRALPLRAAIGLAAAVAVVAGFGGVAVHGELQQRADQRAAQAVPGADASTRAAADRQESEILAAPDARVVNRRMPDGSTLTFLVSRSRNAALVITAQLADPGAGRTYQLWTGLGSGQDATFLPDRTFGGGSGQRILVSGDVRDATALAVTVEHAGGALTPSGPPVAVAPI